MWNRLKFWGQVSDAEVEAIANRKLMESLLSISIARTETTASGLLDASRLINQRAADIERKQEKKKYNWLQVKVRLWLGIDDSRRIDDLRFIREQFKTLGDAQTKGGKRYHVAVCQYTAQQLIESAEQHKMPYLADAGRSVSQLTARFIDEQDKDNDNNDSRHSAST